jgi:hypothetical protein
MPPEGSNCRIRCLLKRDDSIRQYLPGCLGSGVDVVSDLNPRVTINASQRDAMDLALENATKCGATGAAEAKAKAVLAIVCREYLLPSHPSKIVGVY